MGPVAAGQDVLNVLPLPASAFRLASIFTAANPAVVDRCIASVGEFEDRCTTPVAVDAVRCDLHAANQSAAHLVVLSHAELGRYTRALFGESGC